MARPRKPIDKEQLEKLAEKQWHTKEIGAFFKVDESTIKRRFGDLIEECRHRGKAKLRDLQWKRAQEGSDRMILHMSKHYLDQHDKLEQELKVKTSMAVINRLDGEKTILKAENVVEGKDG